MKNKFPFDHAVDCIQKIVWINWDGNGQIGRYGAPYLVNKFYPGFTAKFVSKEYLETLKNQSSN